jgi:hypothetical protein
MGFRFYVCTDEGLRRISREVFEERASLPQFANTRQKTVEAVTQRRDGRLFARTYGTYSEFDADGCLCVPLKTMLNAYQLVEAHQAIEKERLEQPKVAEIGLRRRHNQLQSSMQWTLSAAEREAIDADLLGSDRPRGTRPIPLLRSRHL